MTERVQRVAVLGASGLVGRVLLDRLGDGVEVHGFDRRPDRPHGVRRLDARRLRRLTRVLSGFDAVVDLAASARVDTPWPRTYRTNLKIVPTVLEAARRAGVPRVVFASSHHTVVGYEAQEPWVAILAGRRIGLEPTALPRLPVDASPLPRSAYGASKVFGEAACEWYAGAFGMETTAVRIGTVLSPDRPRSFRHLSTWLSHRDLVDLVAAALACPADQLPRAVWGVSANTWRMWDDRVTYPGFTAQDDAEDYRSLLPAAPQ